MEKTRATTIQQKLGFKDEDLKTSKHDEIMLWVSNHAFDIVVSILGTRAQWAVEQADELNASLEEAYHPIEHIIMADLPAREPASVNNIKWELPIMSGNYVVGFIDLALQYLYDDIVIRTGGWAISSPNATVTWEVERCARSICIEVKSSIPSVGELIRQIQLYRQYQKGIYVVVSPDARYADVLRSQGIEFYHYSPDLPDEWSAEYKQLFDNLCTRMPEASVRSIVEMVMKQRAIEAMR